MLRDTKPTLPCRQNKSVRPIKCSLHHYHSLSLIGLFNLPGANRTQIPPILFIPGVLPPMLVQTFGIGIRGGPNLSRQSCGLYIGSITTDINEQNLTDFFSEKMNGIGTGRPGNSVLVVRHNYKKSYVFIGVCVGAVLHYCSYPNISTVPLCRRRHSCHGVRWYHFH